MIFLYEVSIFTYFICNTKSTGPNSMLVLSVVSDDLDLFVGVLGACVRRTRSLECLELVPVSDHAFRPYICLQIGKLSWQVL